MLAIVTDATIAADSGWTPSRISQYITLRAGRRPGAERIWRGSGSLTNFITGEHIAQVEVLERCCLLRRNPEGGGEFISDRVMIYHDADGDRLAQYGGRTVPTIRYQHHVCFALGSNGTLLVQAKGLNGKPIASACSAVQAVRRIGIRRRFELSLRPVAGGHKTIEELPTMVPGTSTIARSKASVTREEYCALGPVLPSGEGSYRYRRCGRSPSWYGSGMCALDLDFRTESFWSRFRHCLQREANNWDDVVHDRVSR